MALWALAGAGSLDWVLGGRVNAGWKPKGWQVEGRRPWELESVGGSEPRRTGAGGSGVMLPPGSGLGCGFCWGLTPRERLPGAGL